MCSGGPGEHAIIEAEALKDCKQKILDAYHIYEQQYRFYDEADPEIIWDSFVDWIMKEIGGGD